MNKTKRKKQSTAFLRRRFIISPRFQGELTGFFAGTVLIAVLASYWQTGRLIENFNAFCGLDESATASLCRSFVSAQSGEVDRSFLVIGVLVMIFVVVGGVLLTHRVAGPIHRMTRHIGELKKGHLQRKLSFRKSDYFQEIVAAVNEEPEPSVPVDKNDKGFSLGEVMVSLGLLSIVMMGSLSLLDSMNRNQATTQLLISRNNLFQLLQLNLSSARAMNQSLSDTTGTNAQLIQCVQGGAASSACPVGAEGSRTVYEFLLYSATGSLLAGPSTGAHQVSYDAYGAVAPAVSGVPGGIFQAVASFTAECSTPAETECQRASVLNLRLSLIRNPNVTRADAGILAPKVFNVSMKATEVAQSALVCPPSQYVTGFNPNGSLICIP